jgi:hypothetical protein
MNAWQEYGTTINAEEIIGGEGLEGECSHP